MYPLEVVAPLFSQVCRVVAFNMSKVVRDPTVFMVFTPVASRDSDEGRTEAYGTSYYKMITTTMKCVVNSPQWWESAAANLAALGAEHERMGVTHLHYAMANKLFVEAMETLCGEQVFTPVHKAALVQLLSLAAVTALRGTETLA
jgi:hypothetical protein